MGRTRWLTRAAAVGIFGLVTACASTQPATAPAAPTSAGAVAGAVTAALPSWSSLPTSRAPNASRSPSTTEVVATSRGRTTSSAVAVTTVTVTPQPLKTTATAAAAPSTGSRATGTASSTVRASQSAAPGGRLGLPIPPPRLTTAAADFASPEAVTAQYLAAWCWMPLDGPANQNIANAALWMSAAGWADDKTRAIGRGTWQQIVADGTSTVCGPAKAVLYPSPRGTPPGVRFVTVTATRYRVQNRAVISTDIVRELRVVRQAADGRWFVDVIQEAG